MTELIDFDAIDLAEKIDTLGPRPLTWRQFKELVDTQLKEMRQSEDIKIWYIDISFPDKDTITIKVDEDLGLWVG